MSFFHNGEAISKCPRCEQKFRYLSSLAIQMHMEQCQEGAMMQSHGSRSPSPLESRRSPPPFAPALAAAPKADVIDLCSPVAVPMASAAASNSRGGGGARRLSPSPSSPPNGEAAVASSRHSRERERERGRGRERERERERERGMHPTPDSQEDEEPLWQRMEKRYESDRSHTEPVLVSTPAHRASSHEGKDAPSRRLSASASTSEHASVNLSPYVDKGKGPRELSPSKGPKKRQRDESPVANPTDGMPDYQGMDLDSLKDEMRKYGLKASGLARSRMVKTLQDLWQQLQQQQQKAATTKKAAVACMADEERAKVQAKEDSKQRKADKKLGKDRDAMVCAIQTLRTLPIFDKLLMLEPVHVKEVSSALKEEGVKISERLVKLILEQHEVPLRSAPSGARGRARRY